MAFFVLEQLYQFIMNEDKIYINSREELEKLLKNYPSGSPCVIINENVDLSFLHRIIDIENIDMSNWDMSRVTNTSFMFSYTNFNGDISKWNMCNVIYADGMFYNSKFNGDISQWKLPNLKYMNGMFADSDFNQDISEWKLPLLEEMDGAFIGSKFDQDISKWYLPNIKSMQCAFECCPVEYNKKYPSWYQN